MGPLIDLLPRIFTKPQGVSWRLCADRPVTASPIGIDGFIQAMTNKLPSGRKALKAAMLQHFKS